MDSSIAKRGQKMLKKVIFIICLLLLLLSMASVSASDMENSTILADYDSSDEILKSDEVNSNDVVDASNNYDTLNEASFDILQDYIDTASEGAEISLSQDYSLSEGGNTIKIDKTLTINGKNHTLNGNDQKTILSITADGKTVTLKDIIFSNGKSSGNGGAILNTHSSTALILINCIFKDNTAHDNGGAIYTSGKLNIFDSAFQSNEAKDTSGGAIFSDESTTIKGCSFDDNYADSYGGAIYSGKDITIRDCSFDNNKADLSGGAVYGKRKTSIINSQFRKNKVTFATGKCYGGAIRAIGECDIVLGYFALNYADNDGGAIYADNNLIVSDSRFIENNVDDSYGVAAAIYCNGTSTINNSEINSNNGLYAVLAIGKCYIDSCSFNKNGACSLVGEDNLVITGNTKFTNNKNDGAGGGAIYAYKNLYINWNDADGSCEFNSNTGSEGCIGGAIYCEGNIYAKSIKCYQNHVPYSPKVHGGAVFCKGETHFNNSEFIDNWVMIPSTLVEYMQTDGGAIWSNGKCYIDSCIFKDNQAGVGGAIFANSSMTITGQNVFTNNTVINNPVSVTWHPNGGAIYAKGSLSVSGANFTLNIATVDGGAIFCEGECTISDSRFVNNSADDGYAFVPYVESSYGGAVRSKGSITVKNSIFEDNYAYTNGGAIYADKDIKVTGSTFIHNHAPIDGGAIFSNGKTTISDSQFIENYASHTQIVTVEDSYGGAIRSKGLITINNCSFEDNLADDYGGAIYADGEIIINGSSLSGDHARYDGGAVYCMGNVKIDNSIFSNNNVDELDGGAIYCNGAITISNSKFDKNEANGYGARKSYGGAVRSNGFASIKNSSFENNFAYNLGGAIYVDNKIEILNSTFKNNIVYVDGGAVYSENNANIYNSKFIGNNATKKTEARSFGGAVYSGGLSTVEGSNFTDNFATNRGGAIFAFKEIIIKDSKFTGNTAGDYGGAVYTRTINQEVFNSTFNKNKVSNNDGGAIYINNSCNPSFNLCTFEDNKAPEKGGAIYVDSKNAPLRLSFSTFTGNKAGEGGAVYTGTMYGANRYSVFINNTATSGDGGAIYINNACTVQFATCRFENNHCDNRGGAIYLDSKSSELSLKYCTFVDNIADKNNYNGTFYHHGGGQSVFNSGDYKFIDQCWFGKNNPSYKDQFVVYHESANDKDYTPDNCLKIDIEMNDTEFYIGREYQVNVYFYTIKIPGIISNRTVYLDGDLMHSDGHFTGWAKFSLENVGFNNMTANVLLNKDKPIIVLTLDHQTVTLTLNAKNTISSEVRILSCENVTYPDSVKVDYEIINMTSARYIVYDINGTPIIGGKITNPKDRLTFDNLIVGKYSLAIINAGNNSVNSSSATAIFYVYENLGSANATADNVTYGENTTITLKAETDGLYKVSINGTVLEMEVINGIATRQIKLNAGNYQTITSAGEGRSVNCNEASFSVYKADPNFKINVSKDVFDYGEEILVTYHLPPDATSSSQMGAFAYYINNAWYGNFEMDDEVKLTGLDAGSYFVEAFYSGDRNYNLSKSNVSFNVVKLHNNVIVNVSNVTYGETSIIEIHADVDGTYQLIIEERVYDVPVENHFGAKSFKLDAGTYHANVTFDNDNYITTVQNASFSVYKADIDLVLVVFDEVYGDEIECLVYADRDGEYNLTIADYSTVITVKESFAYYEHSTLDVGTYQSTVSFYGDKNYNSAFNITTFTVYPAGTNFELEVNPNPIKYGETATVTHSLPEDATGTIRYYLSNGTFLGELGLSENLTLPVLDAGTYHILGNYSGDHNYIPSTDSTVLIVNKKDNIVVVSASNVTYGNETLIEITADVDGTYQLDVNGTIYNVPISNGIGNKTISLNAGKYYANASFEDRNYNTTIENASFEVYKADINLILIALDTVYSVDLEGAIYSNVDGEYNLTVGNYSTIVIVTDGLGEFNAGILDAGPYEIVANYSGDSNHNPIVKTFTVTVYPALNNAVVSASNVTYGNDAIIEVTADIDGTYQLDVNGTVYNITIENGAGNKIISLNAGKYYANLSFDNKNYNSIIKNASFEVYKASTMIFVVAYHCVYPDEIEGIVLADVDGEYNLTIGDYSSTILVEDGFVKFNAGVFDAGEYTVEVTYPGDLNHLSNSSSDDVKVYQYVPDIILNVEDIDYGGVAVISITCDIPGSVNVTVNGITETLELNGQNKARLFATLLGASSSENKASLNLYNLDSGKYPVTVTYNGNKNYESVRVSDEFNVNALNVTMDIDAVDIHVGDDETITVKLSLEVNGTIIVTIDGKNYTAQAKDGKAVLNIPDLSAGHKTAAVYYSGDTNYNPAEGNVSFTVSKLKADISASANEPSSGEKIHITVTVPKDATGTVTISLEGKNYTAPVKNGKAIFNIPGLPAGKYEFTAYYSGDDKYEEAQISSNITVKDNGGKDKNHTDNGNENHSQNTGIKTVGNPILALLLSLMIIGSISVRRFKK